MTGKDARHGPHPYQQQDAPGPTEVMDGRPDHGESVHRGDRELDGRDLGLQGKIGRTTAADSQTKVRVAEPIFQKRISPAALIPASPGAGAQTARRTSMNSKLLVIAAVTSLLTGSAFAANSTVTGAAGGAVTGAVVGGPVGAAVGGVAGAIVGTAIAPPERVVTYVQQQPMPADDVVVQDRIVVGHELPESVVVTTVPDDPTYAYAVVNHQRVIVQPKTRKIVQVIE